MMRSTAHKASGGEVGRGEAAPPAGLVSRTAREPEASEQGRNQPEQLRIANSDAATLYKQQPGCGAAALLWSSCPAIAQLLPQTMHWGSQSHTCSGRHLCRSMAGMLWSGQSGPWQRHQSLSRGHMYDTQFGQALLGRFLHNKNGKSH